MTIITDIDEGTYINYWLPLAYKHQDSKFVFHTDQSLPRVTIPKNVRNVASEKEANRYIDDITFLTQKDLIPTYETMVYLENLTRYEFVNPKVHGTDENTNSFTVRNDYMSESAIDYPIKHNLKNDNKLTLYKV